ncbi:MULTISPECIES: ferritin-like domain-containing protein [unclassified Thioalkalivibrio]|uniref:ferritin-like domain-containing protein n=1 Tax=unclassified Thioalkalivibrio TaxID=2621013 RepID=UPI0003772B87|nr:MULTISPECIES: ferritin-like domain-containing protein [unclassified Thioalkalivibrio]
MSQPITHPASPDLYQAAEMALRECDPETKCERVLALMQAWWSDELEAVASSGPERLEVPGRPERPVLVHPKDLPRRGLHTTAGRVALVHAVAHIEFNAINLALDAVYRFRDMPAPFVSDWLQVAAEEARHFRLLRARLHELGADYGDLPAHNGLWEAALATDQDVMIRMALVPRVLEARGLDVTPGMIERLMAAGDHATVALLEIIQREEVAHVAIGSRWFRELAHVRGLDPEPLFLELLAEYMPGRVRPPFAHEARRAAGFTDSEMAQLEAQATAETSP